MFPLFLLFLFAGSSCALNVPLTRRAANHSATVSFNPHYNGDLGWSNVGNYLYSATVYIQGNPFQVQIDSGSSDLWVNTEGVTLNGVTNTGLNGTITYEDKTDASGPIILANVSLGAFTVDGQAMINAPGANASKAGVNAGLLGVGPPATSMIYQQVIESNLSIDGVPFMSNLFGLRPSEPSFITFLLSRSYLGLSEGGVMTISELVSNYSAVTEAPNLPVVSPEFWMTYMDGVCVNGQLLTGNSFGAKGLTPQPSKNQVSILLDTGTSLASAPPYYVDAMYKDMPGAVFNKSLNTYELPCDTKMNISMLFGSNKYSINPIDATWLNVNPDHSLYCYGSFAYSSADDGVDFTLGDVFMRNVYTLLNYGSNFTGHGTEPAYMQILSITDADEAWAEFDYLYIERLLQSEYAVFTNSTSSAHAASGTASFSLVSPTSSAAISNAVTATSSLTSAGAPTGSRTSSASATSSSAAPEKLGGDLAADVQSGTSNSANDDWRALKRNSYIIIGLLVVVLLLLLGIAIRLVLSARSNRYKQVPTFNQPVHFEKPYDPENEAFSNPYDDPARPLRS